MKNKLPSPRAIRLKRSVPVCLALASSLSLSTSSLHAYWTGANDNNYNLGANWSGGVPDGIFTGTLVYTTKAEFSAANGTSFTGGLTFNYDTATGLTLIPPGGANNWALGGNILVSINSLTNGQGGAVGYAVNLGNGSRVGYTLNLGGAVRTFAINPELALGNTSGADTLALWGTITNGSILKTGTGLLEIDGTVNTTGDIIVAKGIVSVANVANSNITNVGKVAIQGPTNLFRMFTRATQSVNSNMAVDLNGGGFFLANGTVANTTTSLGTVTLQSGRSVIGIGSTVGTLSLDSLVRNNSSLLNLSGLVTPGTNSIKVVNDANLLAGLVGGGGAAGTQTVSILPWVAGSRDIVGASGENRDTSNFGSWGGFVTYDHTGGFRLLTSAEYVRDDFANSGVYSNVQLNNQIGLTSFTGPKTINSLWLTGTSVGGGAVDGVAATYTLASDAVLTITSGAILSVGSVAGGYGTPYNSLNGGTIQAGAGNALIIDAGRTGMAIGSKISGDSGIVLGSSVNLNNTNNDYVGPTVITFGITTTGASEVITNGSAVRVDSGAYLQIGNGLTETIKSLSGSGTVIFSNSSARLNIGTPTGPTAGSTGYVTVNAGGFISPGDPSGSFRANTLYLNQTPGVQIEATTTANANIAGLIFQPGSALYLDLASATSFDSILMSGTAAINGGTLYINLLNGYMPVTGQSFTSIAGTLAATGAGFDSIVDTSGSGLSWTFAASGNNWVLTASAIPEPSTYALFGGAFVLLTVVGLRRKNRRS